MHPNDFEPGAPGQIIRRPTGYWAFIPHPLPPQIEWTPALLRALSQADRALGELAGLGHTLLNPHLLMQPFIRREAVLSSRIEGTRASLSDLYAYEAAGGAVRPALFDLPDDVAEVRNYVRALQVGLQRLQALPISSRLFRELHACLLEGVRGEEWTPGEFRRSQNWIGPPGSTLQTAVMVPSPVEAMQRTLGQLEQYIHAGEDLPPLVRLALIHYQFEVIHPFLDGNGRVGRLLISLLLCAWELLPQPLLYLSAYFEAHRQAYYDHLLAVSTRGAWTTWLIYFLQGVASQAADGIARIRRLQALHDAYRAQFQTRQAAARLLQVVDRLFEQPIFTIPQLADALDVPYPSAQRYVQQLEASGSVREITGQARNRVYRADDILSAIDSAMITEEER
jgi:Fic family protein